MGKLTVRSFDWSKRIIERSHELSDFSIKELREAAVSEDLLGGDDSRGFKGEVTRRFLRRMWIRGYRFVSIMHASRGILRRNGSNGLTPEALIINAERPASTPAHGLEKTLREFGFGFKDAASRLGAERIEELGVQGALNGRTDQARVLEVGTLLIGNFVPEIK